MHSERTRCIFTISLFIMIGAFIGFLILRFPLPFVLASILGIVALGLATQRIEFPFYVSIFLLVIMVEEVVKEGHIFQYFQKIDFRGIPSLLEMVIGLLVISFVIRLFIQKDKVAISPISLPLMIFFGLFLVSLLVGLQNGADRILLKQDFKGFLLPVLFFFCCANILDSSRKIRFVLFLVFIVASIKSWLGIMYYFKGLGSAYGSNTIPFLDSSDHLIFVTVIVVVVSLIVHRRVSGDKFLFVLLAVFPMVFSVIFSYRRTAWLGLVLSLGFLFFLVPGSKKFKMISIGICGGLIVAVLISLSSLTSSVPSRDFLMKRFLSIGDTKESSNVAHFEEWVATFEDTMKHPFRGLGLGSTHRLVSGFPTLNTHTVHNAFLMLWMKMGIFAVFLFLWCLVRYFSFGVRTSITGEYHELKPVQVGLFSTFGLWAVSLNVGPVWFYHRETCLMALIIALVMNLSNMSNAYKSEHEIYFSGEPSSFVTS